VNRADNNTAVLPFLAKGKGVLMLRTLIIAAFFLIVTVGLLLMQPSSNSDRFVDTSVEDIDTDLVTRQDTALETTVIVPEVSAQQVAIVEPVAPAAPQAAEPVLRLQNIQPVNITQDQDIAPTKIRGLEPLIASALSQGMTGEEIDILIAQAVQSGLIKVPAQMMRLDGSVDTRAVLATLVQIPSPAPKVERPLGNTYIVRPGDTLAIIAQRYYGTRDAVNDIYWANKDRLPNPDALNIGQTLFLPQL